MNKLSITLLIVVYINVLSNDEEILITKNFTEEIRQKVSWEVIDFELNPFNSYTMLQLKKMLLRTPATINYSEKKDIFTNKFEESVIGLNHPYSKSSEISDDSLHFEKHAEINKYQNYRKYKNDIEISSLNSHPFFSHYSKRYSYKNINKNFYENIPQNYDYRQLWPNCIFPIKSQGLCGGCYAIAFASMMSNRYCILTNERIEVSSQDIISCDLRNYGCSGGYVEAIIQYSQNEGIVSANCKKYSSENGRDYHCNSQCDDGTFPKFRFGCMDFKVLRSESEIKNEILQNGPIIQYILVYSDLFLYSSGIYHHVGGYFLGHHLVKIIGFGIEQSRKYYLIENSWGESYGMGGYLKVQSEDPILKTILPMSCIPYMF